MASASFTTPQVPAALSLAQLHEVLQASFTWSGEHLYRFTVHGREFGSGQLGWADPSTVGLGGLGLRESERFTYAYDFFSLLGCWRHDLRAQAITPPRPRRRYPWYSGGARTAPPEDCGGPEAFLALRHEHGLFDTTMRMAELATLLLEAPPTSTVREVLGEAIEELPGLLYWGSSRDTCNRGNESIVNSAAVMQSAVEEGVRHLIGDLVRMAGRAPRIVMHEKESGINDLVSLPQARRDSRSI